MKLFLTIIVGAAALFATGFTGLDNTAALWLHIAVGVVWLCAVFFAGWRQWKSLR